jgi:hypothetical protein
MKSWQELMTHNPMSSLMIAKQSQQASGGLEETQQLERSRRTWHISFNCRKLGREMQYGCSKPEKAISMMTLFLCSARPGALREYYLLLLFI